MSGFVELTPIIQIRVQNPFLHAAYPDASSAGAIIDTGYQGFLAIPQMVYHVLGLDELVSEERKVALADGTVSDTKGSYATMLIPHLGVKLDGFVETFRGLDEILVGVEALTNLRLVLDYCTRKMRLEKCR